MLRTDDMKPEPPEPSLYEKVKAIYEGDGIESNWWNNVWSCRQHEIFSNHYSLWSKAEEKYINMCKQEVWDEYAAHIICDFALKIAKEQDNE